MAMIDKTKATRFLRSYDYYNANEVNVDKIMETAYKAKAKLRSILSRHPKWDDAQEAIIFNEDFQTGINRNDIRRFVDWVCLRAKEMDLFRDLQQKYFFVDEINNLEVNYATETFAEAANKLFDVNATVGQKVSRIVNKICKKIGLSEYKDIKPIFQNGETREKDYGYNYYFAMFGDAINPISISKYTVISINPLDYWTMSFGKNWASCHDIDKHNLREISSHTYEGCYSAGTESYMLDETSVVFYTVDKNYEGEMWKADKDRRMMFHINEDGNAFIFGRLYPDGRDGGETGLAAQFRMCVQRVLSDCVGETNLWTVKKGTGICSEMTISTGPHYRDYTSYSDCGFSLRKGKYSEAIEIGHNAICPSCGEEHYNEQCIYCECCDDMSYDYHCACCGRGIAEGQGYYCDDTDEDYCSMECANNSGVVNTENDGLHRQTECYQDDYTRDWYYGDPEIVTREGYVYADYDNAYNDGVMYDDYEEEFFMSTRDTVITDFGNFRNEENAREFGLVNIDGRWMREEDAA